MTTPLFSFSNSLTKALPGDLSGDNISRLTPAVSYSLVNPTPVKDPEIVLWSEDVAKLLDLEDPKDMKGLEAKTLSGNLLNPDSPSYAVRYAGHQFGNWAGQLGDGRAISLGEVVNKNQERLEVQLKGAGVTPYSRRADGRAVFRSSLREFLCSEAMHYLGVPTTRALALVVTGDKVVRDMFYDGRPEEETGAIVTRVSPTFIRFGNFEVHSHFEEHELLKDLLDYTVSIFFPEHSSQSDEGISKWFEEVCERTATLMVEWIRVGFVHGVMNTDNMSILGLTIDYGPYGFLDSFDPSWTPNTTDKEHKRYRYEAQAQIAYWNLARLGEALIPLLKDPEVLNSGLEQYRNVFHAKSKLMMANKLGFETLSEEEDIDLLSSLNDFLTSSEIDMTIFYRSLNQLVTQDKTKEADANNLMEIFKDCFYDSIPSEDSLSKLSKFSNIYLSKVNSLGLEQSKMTNTLNNANPYFILRNYLVQEAIDAFENGDRSVMESLFLALKTPYEENENTKPFFKKRPDWARVKAGCSMLSCSS